MCGEAGMKLTREELKASAEVGAVNTFDFYTSRRTGAQEATASPNRLLDASKGRESLTNIVLVVLKRGRRHSGMICRGMAGIHFPKHYL